MTTIQNTTLDASGLPVAGVAVVARLIAAAGFLAAGGEIIEAAATTSADDGTWSLTLTPLVDLEVSEGAYYLLREGTREYSISVPDGGPYPLFDVLIEVPGERGEVGLSRTEADAIYQQLTGKGAAGGYASLDSGGKVPEAQLPASASGVSSVNGQTGVVVLDAADVDADPEGTGAAQAAGAVAEHEGESNPHPVYLTSAEGNAAYDTIGAATGAVSTHTAAGDPHPQYLTSAEGNAAYDASGAASGAVSTHTGATDPHGDRGYTDTQVATRVPNTRQVATGTGLLGGGDLSANRTITPDFGTGSGKVTQGNDSRLSDARTPTAHASSHAAAGSDPLTGYAPRQKLVTAYFKLGDITHPNTSNVWATLLQTGGVLPYAVSIAAAVGDQVVIDWAGMRSQTSGPLMDVAILGSGGTPQWHASSDTNTPALEGDPAWYVISGFIAHPGRAGRIIQSGDIVGGNVTFTVLIKSNASAGTFYSSTNYPFRMVVENRGPA